MGVHGLWKLIEASGKAVPLEALENRILAVDVSIWLYQLIKGFQERAGHSVANAYLLGLFHRICKLLFYRIKPIFVFDGGVPSLKRKTIAARQNNRAKANLMGEKLRQALLENLVKQEALGKALGENVVLPKLFQPKQDSLFSLPPLPTSEQIENDSDSEIEKEKYRYKDLQSIDITSEEFLSLPADMRHDILTELKETRKQNSWAKLHLMPEEGGEFSDFQMRRLLKRRAIQVGIEKAEGEMGTRGFTISDLQSILSDQGVDLAHRIAADSSTRLLYNNKIKEITKDISSKPSTSKKIKSPKYCDNTFLMESDNSFASLGSTSSSEDEENIESLTQAEILELIKQESISSKCQGVEIVQEEDSTLTCSQLEDMKTEEGTKLTLNDGALENEPENNALHLEHEILPQASNHCQLSSPRPTLSQTTIQPHSSVITVNSPSLIQPLKTSHNLINNTSNILSESNIRSDLGKPMVAVDNIEHFEMIVNKRTENIPNPQDMLPSMLSSNNNVFISKSEEECNELGKISNAKTSKENASFISESEESDNDFIDVNDEEIKESIVDSSLDCKENNKLIPSAECISTGEKERCLAKPLEIVINSAESLEDDLFADVFNNKLEKSPSNEEHILNYRESEKELEKSKCDSLLVTKKSQLHINSDEENKVDMVQHLENIKASSPIPQLSIKEVVQLKKDLEHESDYLIKESGREDRIASTITEQIRLDAQELLKLFGVPYIIAPLEAEAQCAYLDLTGQTQGTITDDSDIWLFGGINVYKNFFDQKKFVQQFKATDINKCLQIGRDEMIMLALLSGSDYTVGLTGVGAVTALEVIAHYPKPENESSPTERLKHFAKDFQTNTLVKSIAKKLKKATLSEGFPSAEVVNAYLNPEVDKSSEAFSWSKPNAVKIRQYAREKFGWDYAKTDAILDPILENLQKTQTQGTLHRYFDWKFDNLANTRSKRVENALNLLKTPSLLEDPSRSSISRPPIQGKKKNDSGQSNNLLLKSKTPAQIAREKAAKKFKELKKQGKILPKSNSKR